MTDEQTEPESGWYVLIAGAPATYRQVFLVVHGRCVGIGSVITSGETLAKLRARIHRDSRIEKLETEAPEAMITVPRGEPRPRDVHCRLTELVDENFGYRPTMPIEKLLTVLETEVPALVKTLEAVTDAAWSFTELDVEHTISCHTDSLPVAYRRACAVLDQLRTLTSADLEAIERAP